MKRRQTWLSLLCLLLLIALGMWIKNSSPEASFGKKKQAPALLVETRSLTPEDFPLMVSSFGTLKPQFRAEIHSLVNGQILWLSDKFKEGNVVDKGELLLRIDDSDYILALQEARGQLANAQLTLEEERARSAQAARDWATQKKKVPENDFALRKPQLFAAEENLRTAQARLKMAQLNLERCQVRANFSGHIEKVHVDLGMVVSPGVMLAEGYEDAIAEVRLPVDASALKYIDVPGAEVIFSNSLSDPPETWQGVVKRTEAALDESSQQVYLVAEIEQPFRPVQSKGHTLALKSGQFLSARIVGHTVLNKLVLPVSATYHGRYVYLVENGRLKRQDFTTLWRSEKDIVVDAGLEHSVELITTPLGQVSSGTLVQTLATQKSDGEQTP